MKIVRFQDSHGAVAYGVLEGESVRGIEGDIYGEFAACGPDFPPASVRLLAPVDPPNVICIGLNYRKHAEESGARFPERPVIFLKPTTAVTGPDTPIRIPEMAPSEVDYEAELGIVVGRTMKDVPEERALDYVLGYTCANDVSARDCQLRLDVQWARAKSFDTFCPIGPCIETEMDPDSAGISLRLNGQTMQQSSTADMIFGCRELLSFLSRCMTLLPGTLITTGTPEGVGFARKPPVFLKPGDVVEVEVEGVGVLRNTVTG